MQSDHFPFIYCVESLVTEDKYDKWETCYEKLNLSSKPVADCLSSGHGQEVSSPFSLLVSFHHNVFLFFFGKK